MERAAHRPVSGRTGTCHDVGSKKKIVQLFKSFHKAYLNQQGSTLDASCQSVEIDTQKLPDVLAGEYELAPGMCSSKMQKYRLFEREIIRVSLCGIKKNYEMLVCAVRTLFQEEVSKERDDLGRVWKKKICLKVYKIVNM